MDSNHKIALKDEQTKNINFLLINKTNLPNNPLKIKEIGGGRILILFGKFFVILDLKTNKQICSIKGTFEKEKSFESRYYDNMFEDFIELKNKNLILWSSGKIFYYKNCGHNNYELSQVINELKQQINDTKLCQIGRVTIYDLHNIIELENKNLISCNSIGLKIYNFIDNEYKLIKVIRMDIDVENVFQINDNNFLIMHHYTYHSGTCTPCTYHKFGLSLFDKNINKITNKIFYQETDEDDWGNSNYRFNYFLLGDNFIYQTCDFPYKLENEKLDKKEKKVLSLNYNLYNIKDGKNIMNLKTSFCLISLFKDNLIFAQDYESLNLCNFEKNIFTSIYRFDFNDSNLCILKNNDLIYLYEKKEWEEIKCNDGHICRNCTYSYYQYSYYKYLSN